MKIKTKKITTLKKDSNKSGLKAVLVALAVLILPLAVQAGIITEAPSISSILLNALRYLLYIFGFLAIIGISISAAMYLLAGGERRLIEKAKKSLIYSLLGIAITLTSLIILQTIAKIVNR